MKTIGKCGAAYVVWLKSCVFLEKKFALFFGNSNITGMLQSEEQNKKRTYLRWKSAFH